MLSYYRLLGVDSSAQHVEIKKAYHRLARKYHPDHNGGHPISQQRFRLIAEAYEILGDAEKRARYDRFGKEALVASGPRTGLVGGVERLVSDLGSMVEARIKRQPQQGRDCRTTVSLSFREACLGTKVSVEVPQQTTCRHCNGTRSAVGTGLEQCHVCNGKGELKRDSLLPMTDSCLFCEGIGKLAVSPCIECNGTGELLERKAVTVEIPPMVDTGRRLVLKSRGESGINGGLAGDLYISVNVMQDSLLSRDGYDLHCTVPIMLSEAIFGATVKVPTLDGKTVQIKVPLGTKNGQQLRLKGRGLSRKGGSAGDLFITLELETPTLKGAEAHKAVAALEAVAVYQIRQAYDRNVESSD